MNIPESLVERGNLALERVTDVSAMRVARVYAEALLNAADKVGLTQEVGDELVSIVRDVFGAKPEFELLLSSGAISRTAKEEVLLKVFQGRTSEILLNFLRVLNRHDRLDLIRAVRVAYIDIANARARRIHVQVRTAVPLEEDQRRKLIENVRQVLDLDPILDERVIPELLGGLVLRVGDQLYDGSVRSRLVNLRNQILERSSHEIQSGRDRFSSGS